MVHWKYRDPSFDMGKTLVIRTSAFPTEPEGDLDLCNGQPGSAFAEWLRAGMLAKHYVCDPPIQEDYGWGFWVKKEDLTVWVAVGYVGNTGAAEDEVEWAVSSFYEVPFGFLRPVTWFNGGRGRELEHQIFQDLKILIEANPRIKIASEENG